MSGSNDPHKAPMRGRCPKSTIESLTSCIFTVSVITVDTIIISFLVRTTDIATSSWALMFRKLLRCTRPGPQGQKSLPQRVAQPTMTSQRRYPGQSTTPISACFTWKVETMSVQRLPRQSPTYASRPRRHISHHTVQKITIIGGNV